MSLFEDWGILRRIDDALEAVTRQVDVVLCGDDIVGLADLQAEIAFHGSHARNGRSGEESLWKRLYAATVVRRRHESPVDLTQPADLRDLALRYPADLARVEVPSPAPTLGEQLNIARQKVFQLREDDDPDLLHLARIMRAEVAWYRHQQVDHTIVRMQHSNIEWPDAWIELLVRLEADPWLLAATSEPSQSDRNEVIPKLATLIICGAGKALRQRNAENSWKPWFVRWLS